MRIGFIGLGNMGRPMFLNLVKQYPSAVAFDASPAARAQLRDDGVQAPDAIVAQWDAFPQVDLLITMLPHGKAVRQCLLGGEGQPGLIDRLPGGAVVVDMSTSSPVDTKALHAALSERNIALVDAPVSGSVPKARDGTLAIMTGGDTAVLDRIDPVLRSMGARLIRTGATGSAHAMKALNNYVYAAGLMAASEALLLGKALDLDLGILADVFNASSGRNIATETKLRQHMLEGGDFRGGFAMHLMAKDLDIAYSLRELAGFTPRQLELCVDTWRQAREQFPADADNTEILHFLARSLNTSAATADAAA